LRALRANLVFGTDEKRIRTKNKVIDKKSKIGFGSLLSKILDCERMRFSSVHNRGSARTGRRPRKHKNLAPAAPVPGWARPVTIRGFQKTDGPTVAVGVSRGEAL
jgi:hypothetical protein